MFGKKKPSDVITGKSGNLSSRHRTNRTRISFNFVYFKIKIKGMCANIKENNYDVLLPSSTTINKLKFQMEIYLPVSKKSSIKCYLKRDLKI